MILVTGAAGFIGSNVVADLEAAGRGPIAVCDWFGRDDKWRNLAKRRIDAFVTPTDLPEFLNSHAGELTAIIHMGAISATTEKDVDALVRLNINASVALWDTAARLGIPFIYASSAATYGGAETGLVDDENLAAMAGLRPLNAYGWSKKATDEIFLSRVQRGCAAPPQWVGLKFFNVYGPNEYHKGDMRSLVAKLFEPVREGQTVQLFKSDRPSIADGQQKRDFVYVKDCTRAILWLLDHPKTSGIFNLGTGIARSFEDLTRGIGLALGKPVNIEYVDMPATLKGQYQYLTQAEMTKLRSRGLDFDFCSLEEGTADYIGQYLGKMDRYR